MKNSTEIISIILLLAISFTGCRPPEIKTSENPKIEFVVPMLKKRKTAIGSNEEMDMIRSIYNTSASELIQNPKNINAQLKLAEVFIAEGRITGLYDYNYSTALDLLNDLLSTKINRDQRFSALSMKGMVLLSLHRFKDALSIGNEALSLNPNNAGVYGILVDSYVELGRYEEAVEMADKMVSIRPDLRSYSRISYLREIYGQLDGAIDAMDRAVKAGFPGQEQTEWCRVNLGKLYEKSGDIESAEMQYQIALRERVNYPFALEALGKIEHKKGNLKKAEKMLKLACGFIQNASFHESLAAVYRDMNQQQLYTKSFERAVALLRGENPQISRNAQTDFKHHKTDHLHSHSNHSHSEDHHHGHSHEVGLEMAKLLLNLSENYDLALKNALSEYQIRPNNIEINQVLASIYLKIGNLNRAQSHIQQAQVTDCQNPDLICLAGLIELEFGHDGKAQELLNRSFNLDPFQEHVFAEEGKQRLQDLTS